MVAGALLTKPRTYTVGRDHDVKSERTSQKLAAVVTAFGALVATIQGLSDPADKLNHVVNSMGDMATVFEQITAAAIATEQQQEMVTQHVN